DHQAGEAFQGQRGVSGQVSQVCAGRYEDGVHLLFLGNGAGAGNSGNHTSTVIRDTMAVVTNRLLILDTASLYYRAFYGVPDTLRAPDGTCVNAVRGTVDFVSLLVQEHRPDIVIAAWDDDWRPAWRVALLDSYKTHRLAPGSDSDEDTPADLVPQIPL